MKSFFSFIWNEPSNRRFILTAIGLSVLEFIGFKFLYPFPDLYMDSYWYIYAASAHLNISIWPIGYSKFLDALHSVVPSGSALVTIQFFLLQSALLYLLLTLFYFFRPAPILRKVLFVFVFVNPLSLYLCNSVCSDSLFAALSFVWFAELLWVLRKPSWRNIVTNSLLILVCFSIRNNAYYYPLVAALAFFFSPAPKTYQWTGSLLAPILLVLFVGWTRNESFKMTGIKQYSFLTGWQLANNALYIYDQLDIDRNDLPDETSLALHREMRQWLWLRRGDPQRVRTLLNRIDGNFFVMNNDAPLVRYWTARLPKMKGIDSLAVVRVWGQCSYAFEPFGKTVLLHHPIAYFQYFMLRNFRNYALPPLQDIGVYNLERNTINPIAQTWFHYPSRKVESRLPPRFQSLLFAYSALFLLFNILYVVVLIGYWRKAQKLKPIEDIHRFFWLTAVFLGLNLAFSVGSTANILRYQFVPMFILLFATAVVYQYLEEAVKKTSPTKPLPVYMIM